VLLTGASGLLGTWLRRTVPVGVELFGLRRHHAVSAVPTVEADLRDRDATRAAIEATQPDLVIHAAYAHDASSIVDATLHVAEGARPVGAGLIVVSTDAVFSGDGTLRSEASVPDPIADYGRWKAQAERLVVELDAAAAIVRLPLLVSVDPDDLAVARIRHGAFTGTATVWFDDELRQPAMAREVATAIWRLAGLAPSERSGMWHLPGPELLSRYEIAQRTVAALALDDDVIRGEATPEKVVRPRRLLLGADRARRAIGWSPSPIWTVESLPRP
jgi:dTDP-4-dehydrorhamnose reductase